MRKVKTIGFPATPRLPSIALGGRQKPMSTNANVRLGIVGCGEHSHTHAAAAKSLGGVAIVCACDVDEGKAAAWVSRYGAEAAYVSLEAMLGHRDLDGIILCTWPNQHAEQIEMCLNEGAKNILCEKALVTSADEAKRVWTLAKRHQAHLVEASMHRHHPAIRKLDRLLASGELGPVDCVRAAFHNYEPPPPADETDKLDWRYRADCGGGVLYDWMHYLVDTCNHFNDSLPKRVFASGNRTRENGVVHRIYGMIEYQNGRVGIIENSKLASFSNTLQITCAHGILHLPIAWAIQGEVTITLTRRKPEWDFLLADTYAIAKSNAYALELEDFCRVVRDEGTPLVPLRDSVVNALTTAALLESLERERAVEVEALDFLIPP